jgi:hypothetical protein
VIGGIIKYINKKIINKNNNNKNKKQNKKRSNNKSLVEKMFSMRLAPSVNKPKRRPVPKTTTVSLPKCTLKYALAVSNPFATECRGACIPIGGSPSMKTHAYNRFDVTIGTTGNALIYLTPSLANDMPSIFFTTATYAGATQSPFSGGGIIGAAGTTTTLNTGWTSVTHNGPFTAGQLAGSNLPSWGGVYGRVVSAGVRAQYTGTTLNESGLYYCYHDPAHSSVSGLTVSAIGNFGDTNVELVSRKPCELVTFGVASSELDYSIVEAIDTSTIANPVICGTLYPYANGDYVWAAAYNSATVVAGVQVPASGAAYGFGIGTPVGVIGVTGIAGQTVHIEYITHMEFQGAPAGAMLTPNSADPEGAAMVKTAALSMPQMKLAAPQRSSWDIMYTSLKEVWHEAKPIVVPIAERALLSLLA